MLIMRALCVLPESYEADMEWSVQLLRRILRGEVLSQTAVAKGPDMLDDRSGKSIITEKKPYRDTIKYEFPASAKYKPIWPDSTTQLRLNTASTVIPASTVCGTEEDWAPIHQKLWDAAAVHNGVEINPITTPSTPPKSSVPFCGDAVDEQERQNNLRGLAKAHLPKDIDLTSGSSMAFCGDAADEQERQNIFCELVKTRLPKEPIDLTSSPTSTARHITPDPKFCGTKGEWVCTPEVVGCCCFA